MGGWRPRHQGGAEPRPVEPETLSHCLFEAVPDSFWGLSLADNLTDCQAMCNACARAIDRNMAISSGPQVVLNVDRYEGDEDSLSLHPWKVWPMKSDSLGNTAKPVDFFQPNSNAQELFFRFFSNFTLWLTSSVQYPVICRVCRRTRTAQQQGCQC